MLIVATPGVSELHCTVPVLPTAADEFAGVTAIETSTAGVTVTVVEPEIAPNVAVTLLWPKLTLPTSPGPFTVAIVLSAVFQVAEVVTSKVLPSL